MVSLPGCCDGLFLPVLRNYVLPFHLSPACRPYVATVGKLILFSLGFGTLNLLCRALFSGVFRDKNWTCVVRR